MLVHSQLCLSLLYCEHITREMEVGRLNEDRFLRKHMGVWSLTAASLGGVIGSGWLFGSMYAAQAAGPASIVTWIIGGVALALVALVFCELAMVKPESGSLVRYPMYSNGSFVASMVGWGIWLGYAANPPTEASGIVQYLSKFFPGVYNGTHLTGAGILIAIALMLVFVLINYFGIHIFAKVNLLVTILKFIVPTFTLIALLASGFHASNFHEYGGFAPYGWSPALGAIATAGIVFAYTGFRAAVDLAGEAKNPARDVPKAVMIAILIAMLLYVGLEIAFVGSVPKVDLAHGWNGVNLSSPFADLAMSLNLTWLYWMIIADAMISPAGSSFVYTASNSRIVFGLAKNRFFPSYFAKVNPRFGIPTRALVLNFVIGLLYLIPLKSWHNIIEITGALAIYTYSAGAVSVIVFRRAGLTSSQQTIHGMRWIAPLAFVVGSLIVYWAGWSILRSTISLLLLGFVIYLISYVVTKQNSEQLRGGLWIVVYLVIIFVISRFGSFGGTKVIPGPWDSILVAIVSLIIFYWAVASGTTYMKEVGMVERLRQEQVELEGEAASDV